jgi:hypothetical protein
MREMTRRSSTRATPQTFSGSNGFNQANYSSLSQNK